MATRNIVPRATGEGSLGTSAKHWGNIFADNGNIAGRNIATDGSTLDTLGNSVTTLQNDVTTLQHAYAGALTASTVASMTDHTKVYVYTGSETGYTNGNWYYWSGTAWTSGGVYNATALETDKTLTVSGAAADAKVVGDKINNIDNIFGIVYEGEMTGAGSAFSNELTLRLQAGKTYTLKVMDEFKSPENVSVGYATFLVEKHINGNVSDVFRVPKKEGINTEIISDVTFTYSADYLSVKCRAVNNEKVRIIVYEAGYMLDDFKPVKSLADSNVINFKGTGDYLWKTNVQLTPGKRYTIKTASNSWPTTAIDNTNYKSFVIGYVQDGSTVEKDIYRVPPMGQGAKTTPVSFVAQNADHYYICFRGDYGTTMSVFIYDNSINDPINDGLSMASGLVSEFQLQGNNDELITYYLPLNAGENYILRPKTLTWDCPASVDGSRSGFIFGYIPKGGAIDTDADEINLIRVYKDDNDKFNFASREFTALPNESYFVKIRANVGVVLDFAYVKSPIKSAMHHQYTGDVLDYKVHRYNLEAITGFNPGSPWQIQGADIYDKYYAVCQNGGFCTLCTIDNLEINKLGTFPLGSNYEYNHCNVACFGPEKYNNTDKVPLLYVSQCYPNAIDGVKDACWVERIDVNNLSSTTVQKIVFEDDNNWFGYALQWVVDKENYKLIAYGNTIHNSAENNKHRIMVFPLPQLSQGATVTLHASDALDNYLLEDCDNYVVMKNVVEQGASIANQKLIMPVGMGTTEAPSFVYVWDLSKKKFSCRINMAHLVPYEFEDVAVYGDYLLFNTSNGPIFAFSNDSV